MLTHLHNVPVKNFFVLELIYIIVNNHPEFCKACKYKWLIVDSYVYMGVKIFFAMHVLLY